MFNDSFNLLSLDSETLTRWDDAVVLSFGLCGGDIRTPFSFQQLVDEALFVKLDVKEQFQRGRKKDDHTMKWWNDKEKVSEAARQKSLYPSERDVPLSMIVPLWETWVEKMGIDSKKAEYADRNLFDFRKLQHIIEVSLGLEGAEPWNYHNLNDFASVFKAWNLDRYAGIKPWEIPPRFNFTYHDPVHDAALDWLRTQRSLVDLGVIEMPENYVFNGLFYEAR